jgi:sugar lactone lactonase YvrE
MSRAAVYFLACVAPIASQQYTITTFVGGPPASRPVPGTNTAIGSPTGVAVDQDGNLYITGGLNSAFRLDKRGLLTRIAGGVFGFSGDGGLGISAWLGTDVGEPGWPSGVAADGDGNVYVADTYNHRIRRISLDGKIATVAGNGEEGSAGDGGPAIAARLSYPSGLAVDSAGNLYIAIPSKGVVRKVSRNGIITTVAGRGTRGLSGDGGLATDAELRNPASITVDAAGNLYIVDAGISGIRRVSPDGLIATVPGSLPDGFTGDVSADSRLEFPTAVCLDRQENLVFATSRRRVRRLSSDGSVVTVAGDGGVGFAGDGEPAVQAHFSGISSLAIDHEGAIYVADIWNNRVRKISTEGTITTAAGNGAEHFGGDGGPADLAQVNIACCMGGGGMTFDAEGNLYLADTWNSRVRKVSRDGIITTVAGSGSTSYAGDGGPAAQSILSLPYAVAVAPGGQLYIADTYNFRIRKVGPDGIISTIAGTGALGHRGDGGPALSAELGYVYGMTVDRAGNVYLAELRYIRTISPDGIITTIAGPGDAGSGVPFGTIAGLAADLDGSLYLADEATDRILRLAPDGTLTKFAGAGRGYAGDGGPASEAQFNIPWALALDGAGNLYVADWGNRRVRKIAPSGLISTIAGSGAPGLPAQTAGPALEANLGLPFAIAVDAAGNVFVADGSAYAIRVLRPVADSASVRP